MPWKRFLELQNDREIPPMQCEYGFAKRLVNSHHFASFAIFPDQFVPLKIFVELQNGEKSPHVQSAHHLEHFQMLPGIYLIIVHASIITILIISSARMKILNCVTARTDTMSYFLV